MHWGLARETCGTLLVPPPRLILEINQGGASGWYDPLGTCLSVFAGPVSWDSASQQYLIKCVENV